jgi:hypothetical protein
LYNVDVLVSFRKSISAKALEYGTDPNLVKSTTIGFIFIAKIIPGHAGHIYWDPDLAIVFAPPPVAPDRSSSRFSISSFLPQNLDSNVPSWSQRLQAPITVLLESLSEFLLVSWRQLLSQQV